MCLCSVLIYSACVGENKLFKEHARRNNKEQERILPIKIQVFWHVTPCQFWSTIISKEIKRLGPNTCRIAHAHQAASAKKYKTTTNEKYSLMGNTLATYSEVRKFKYQKNFLMFLSLFKKMPGWTTTSLAFLAHSSFINLFTQATCLSWRTAIHALLHDLFYPPFFTLRSNQP